MGGKRALRSAIAGACLVVSFSASANSTWTVGVSDDATINSRTTANSNGIGASLYTGCDNGVVGGAGSNGNLRSLLKFAMPGALANKVTVQRVQLQLQQLAYQGTPRVTSVGFGNLSLQKISVNWAEGSSNSSNVTGAACSGGPTYTTSNCFSGWTFGVPVTGSSYTVGSGSGAFGNFPVTLTWDSNSFSGMNSDVQSWIDNGNNFGYRLISSSEGSAAALQRFCSKDNGGTCTAPQMIITFTTCTAAANTACKVGVGTSSCNEANTTNSIPNPAYTCSCGSGLSGTGTTSCSEINGCLGANCSSGGDTGSSVACHDVAAPGTGFTCTCDTGFSFNGTTCVSSCSGGSNPCGAGGTCSINGSGGWNCACTQGYVSTGGTTPTCQNLDACTTAAKNACVETCPLTGGTCTQNMPSGNKCVDEAPTSTTYHCSCTNAAYTGTNTASCTDLNACATDHCRDGGDTGASEKCHDAVAPNIGYTCDCDSGFSFNGTTCVSSCNPPSSNPCGAGGTCSVNPLGGWNCTCGMGYTSTGGSSPTCVNFDACANGGGNTNCKTSAGNTCNDLPPTSTSYTCTCGTGYSAAAGPSCVDTNGCSPNHCGDGGDTGTLVKCNDVAAPGTGWTCNCDTGFSFNGTTCQSACHSGSNPCNPNGANGDTGSTCSVVGTGGWTCACTSGYVSTGGIMPTCVNLNACTAAANSACVTTQGNGCIDEAPPSTTYHCNCANPAYDGTNTAKCNDKNECAPNHCVDGGDSFASCLDHKAPLTGYDCTCSSTTLWSHGTASGHPSCVDTDECAAVTGNPCVHGTCTNIPLGGGYKCDCDRGFLDFNGNTPSPTCEHPNSCDLKAGVACVDSQAGNRCVDDQPPFIGYTCACDNPAYTTSNDQHSCVDKNACVPDHCGDGGDRFASCIDARAPKAGYTCDCGTGWSFDGKTCVDINECTGGANPCGHGSCSNTLGGYECVCANGYVLSKKTPLTCVASSENQKWTYTVIPGSCSMSGRSESGATALFFLAMLLLIARVARGKRLRRLVRVRRFVREPRPSRRA